MIFLPRQARDKPGENSKPDYRFLHRASALGTSWLSTALCQRQRGTKTKRLLLRHFYTQNDHCSGQTYGQALKKSGVFLYRAKLQSISADSNGGSGGLELSPVRPFWALSLCLSRACLGKMIVFIHKLLKSRFITGANERNATKKEKKRTKEASYPAKCPFYPDKLRTKQRLLTNLI